MPDNPLQAARLEGYQEQERVLRTPLTRAEQLADLDPDEIAEGYSDGVAGEPEPGDNRSLAYWHGWRNGAVDGGHREKDAAQAALVRDMMAREPDIMEWGADRLAHLLNVKPKEHP